MNIQSPEEISPEELEAQEKFERARKAREFVETYCQELLEQGDDVKELEKEMAALALNGPDSVKRMFALHQISLQDELLQIATANMIDHEAQKAKKKKIEWETIASSLDRYPDDKE